MSFSQFGPHLRSVLQDYDRLGGFHTNGFFEEEMRLRAIYNRCVHGNVIDMTMPLVCAKSRRENILNARGEIISRIALEQDHLDNRDYYTPWMP